MANDKSFSGNDMQKSFSIIEYCIQSDDSDSNISKLRADNFNLRLRCYNMSLLIDKCRCTKNNNDTETSINTSITKMDKFLENQKELKSQNALLQEENDMLKQQLNNLKDSPSNEINAMKLKCDQLTNLLNENVPGNEILQDIIKQNDELVKLNIKCKQELSCLQMKNYNLKKKFQESQKQIVTNDSKIFHSTLQKEFNSSIEMSKRDIEGCAQCNTLKVNYEKIVEILTQFFEEYEILTKDLKSKDAIIIDLETKLEKLNSEPVVSDERLIKYKKLAKDALTSVVKKDQEKIQIRKESKETIDYYASEMGKLNHKIVQLEKHKQENLSRQTYEMKTLSLLINEIFKHLSIKNENFTKLIDKSDYSFSELKNSWVSIINSVEIINKHLKGNNLHTNKPVAINTGGNSSNNSSVAQEDTGNVSIQFICEKFNQIKELSNSFRGTFHFNASLVEDLSENEDLTVTDNDRYSPQYKFGNASNDFQKSFNDPFSSMYYDNNTSNLTAYKSFVEHHSICENCTRSSMETLVQKIDELGVVIHRYSELISDVKLQEEQFKTNNRNLTESKDNLCSDDTRISQDLSHLKDLYHDECEKYRIEINAAMERIKNMEKELPSCNERIDECRQKLDHLDSLIDNYKESIQQLVEKYNEKMKELKSQLSECNSKIKSLEAAEETQLVTYQQEINKLLSQNESLSLGINKLCEDLSRSITQTQNIQDDLTKSEEEKSTLKEHIKELERNVNYLSEQNTNLDAIIIDKQRNLKDSLESLSFMTESMIRMTGQCESLTSNINNIYSTMVNMKLIIPDDDTKETCNTIEILKQIAEFIPKIKSTSEKEEIRIITDALISSENNYYEAAMDKRDKLQGSASLSSTSNNSSENLPCKSLNDLTNITSFNESAVPAENIDMKGFKINCCQDIVNNPKKVAIMMQKLVKDNEDFKRRLRERYEENRRLVKVITSNNCVSKAVETVEKLTEECAINNENVEKVKNQLPL